MCLDSRGQCHLLYLAYRCYREIRLGDDAKGYPRWQGDPREKQCSKLRERDIEKMYFDAVGRPLNQLLNPFIARTGFKLDELPEFFSSPSVKWRQGYGGVKWSRIAELTSKLYNAIADSDEVDRVIEAARLLKHNDESTFLIGDGKGLKLPRSCCISIGGSNAHV